MRYPGWFVVISQLLGYLILTEKIYKFYFLMNKENPKEKALYLLVKKLLRSKSE